MTSRVFLGSNISYKLGKQNLRSSISPSVAASPWDILSLRPQCPVKAPPHLFNHRKGGGHLPGTAGWPVLLGPSHAGPRSLSSQQTQEVGDVLQQTFREGKKPAPGHTAVGSELGFALRSTNSQAHALSWKAIPRLSTTGDKDRAEEVPAG